MSAKKLAGKVAIVTGASKGIGAAVAKQLAVEGASVVVNYASSKSAADRVVAEIAQAGGKATDHLRHNLLTGRRMCAQRCSRR